MIAGLRRRHDRRAALLKDFDRSSVSTSVFAQDVCLSVDWRDWTTTDVSKVRQHLFPWMIPASPNPWWCRKLKLGEIACTLTHWNIWRYAHDSGFPRVIVLEDDAELLPEFKRRELLLNRLSRVDPEWGLLYFGREQLEADRGILGEFALPGF